MLLHKPQEDFATNSCIICGSMCFIDLYGEVISNCPLLMISLQYIVYSFTCIFRHK